MKKKLFMEFLIALLILTFTAAAALADTKSFTLSCSIPSIPGVNAPLIEEENTKAQPSASQEQTEEENQTTEEKSSEPLLLDTTEETKQEATYTASVITVKTIYSR